MCDELGDSVCARYAGLDGVSNTVSRYGEKEKGRVGYLFRYCMLLILIDGRIESQFCVCALTIRCDRFMAMVL